VAGIDVGKAKADVCTRLPAAREGGRRVSRVEEVPATAREVLALAGRLIAGGVEVVVMESTSDYWRIWYYLLGAPRGAVYSCGDGRAPPPGRRSGLVKLEAA
jgi:transposase